MSQTTGTGAKKILGTDNWRDIFDIHNDTVDAYDGKIGTVSMPTTAQTLTGAVAELDDDVDKVADGLAIIANGNTHAAITAGHFVFIRKHDSLATGLYKATANVAANGTLSSSNVTADPSGGLNALSEQIGNMFSPSQFRTAGISYATGTEYLEGGYLVFGNFVLVSINVRITDFTSSLKWYVSLPSAIKPAHNIPVECIDITNDEGPFYGVLSKNTGNIHLRYLTKATNYAIHAFYSLAT